MTDDRDRLARTLQGWLDDVQGQPLESFDYARHIRPEIDGDKGTLSVRALCLAEACSQSSLAGVARNRADQWRRECAREETLQGALRAERRARVRTLMGQLLGDAPPTGDAIAEVVVPLLERRRLPALLGKTAPAPDTLPSDWHPVSLAAPDETALRAACIALATVGDAPIEQRLAAFYDAVLRLLRPGGADGVSRAQEAVSYLRHAEGQARRARDRRGKEYTLPGLFDIDGSEGRVIDLVITVFQRAPGEPMAQVDPAARGEGIEESAADALAAVRSWLTELDYRPAPRTSPLEDAGLALVLGDYPGGFDARSARSAGRSLGLALSMALLAYATDQDITPNVAATGAVSPSGTVGMVGGIANKAEAAAWRGILALVVPDGQTNAGRVARAEAEVGVQRALDAGAARTPMLDVAQRLGDAQTWFFSAGYEGYRERLTARAVQPAPPDAATATGDKPSAGPGETGTAYPDQDSVERVTGALMRRWQQRDADDRHGHLVLLPWWHEGMPVDPAVARDAIVARLAAEDTLWHNRRPVRPVLLKASQFAAAESDLVRAIHGQIASGAATAPDRPSAPLDDVERSLQRRHFLLVCDETVESLEPDQMRNICRVAGHHPVLLVGCGSRWGGKVWWRHINSQIGETWLWWGDRNDRERRDWAVVADLLDGPSTIWDEHIRRALTPGQATNRGDGERLRGVDQIMPLRQGASSERVGAFFDEHEDRQAGRAYYIPRLVREDSGRDVAVPGDRAGDMDGPGPAPMDEGAFRDRMAHADDTPTRVALLIGPGTEGKTTFLLKWMMELWRRREPSVSVADAPVPIPLYVPLRKLTEDKEVALTDALQLQRLLDVMAPPRWRHPAIQDVRDEADGVAGVDPARLFAQGGSYLLLLDGLNELPASLARESSMPHDLATMIDGFTGQARSGAWDCTVVLTTRDAGQAPGLDLDKTVETLKTDLHAASYHLVQLDPERDARPYIRNLLKLSGDPEREQALWAYLGKSRRIIESPLYIHLVTEVGQEIERLMAAGEVLTPGRLQRAVHDKRIEEAIRYPSPITFDSGPTNDRTIAVLKEIAYELALHAAKKGRLDLQDAEVAAALDPLVWRSETLEDYYKAYRKEYRARKDKEDKELSPVAKDKLRQRRDKEMASEEWPMAHFYPALLGDLARLGLILIDG